MAVWSNGGKSPTLYSDPIAEAGLYLSGRKDISVGPNGTEFYLWGDNVSNPNRRPKTVAGDKDMSLIAVERNQDGSVTIVSNREDTKVHVMADKLNEEHLGVKWAAEIEASRGYKIRRVAERAGETIRNLVAKN